MVIQRGDKGKGAVIMRKNETRMLFAKQHERGILSMRQCEKGLGCHSYLLMYVMEPLTVR